MSRELKSSCSAAFAERRAIDRTFQPSMRIKPSQEDDSEKPATGAEASIAGRAPGADTPRWPAASNWSAPPSSAAKKVTRSAGAKLSLALNADSARRLRTGSTSIAATEAGSNVVARLNDVCPFFHGRDIRTSCVDLLSRCRASRPMLVVLAKRPLLWVPMTSRSAQPNSLVITT